MNTSPDELRGVPKGWAHVACPLPLGAKRQNFFSLFYFFSVFQNKMAEIRGANDFWSICFYMKNLGSPLDELAPTGESPLRRPCHGVKYRAQIQPTPLQGNQTRPQTFSLKKYSPISTRYPFTCHLHGLF